MICTNCGKHPAVYGYWCWRCDEAPAVDHDDDATEAELEQWLISAVKDMGGTARKVHPKNGCAGRFDLRIWIYGRSWHVELKKNNGNLSKPQVNELSRLRAANKNCCVLWGGDEIRDFVEGLEAANEAWEEAIAV